MTLVAPLKWNSTWVLTLLVWCVEAPLSLPARPYLLLQSLSEVLLQVPDGLILHVFWLFGGPLDVDAYASHFDRIL